MWWRLLRSIPSRRAASAQLPPVSSSVCVTAACLSSSTASRSDTCPRAIFRTSVSRAVSAGATATAAVASRSTASILIGWFARDTQLSAQDGARQHVIELAHIGRASRRLDSGHCRGDHNLGSPSCAQMIEEVPREDRDVATALAQRRDAQRKHGEPVVQVGAEPTVRDLGRQIAVGRRHNPEH